jgi:nucleotide-binding universal stress UspA family protein
VGVLVVGYDGTEGAKAALHAATGLARELGDSLVAVFAHATIRLGGEVRDYDDAIRERGRGLLEEARSVARDARVPIELEGPLERSPAEALIEIADAHDARMIVVGSYGERPLKSALVGSTPTRLLHLSERPVLVVRGQE